MVTQMQPTPPKTQPSTALVDLDSFRNQILAESRAGLTDLLATAFREALAGVVIQVDAGDVAVAPTVTAPGVVNYMDLSVLADAMTRIEALLDTLILVLRQPLSTDIIRNGESQLITRTVQSR